MVEFFRALSEVLSQHGGWGLAAVAFFVTYKIYLKREQDRKEFADAMENRHNEFTMLLRETQDTLGSVAVIIQKCQGPENDG